MNKRLRIGVIADTHGRNTIPRNEWIEFGAQSIDLPHNINELDLEPSIAGMMAVIDGHSHRPSIEYCDQVLFLTRAALDPRRFSLPNSIGLLDIEGDTITLCLIDLTEPQQRRAGLNTDPATRLPRKLPCMLKLQESS